MSLQSASFSNRIPISKIWCKYDVLGKCNDKDCSFWHYDDTCNMAWKDIFVALSEYDPSIMNINWKIKKNPTRKDVEKFVEGFFESYKEIKESDQLLLVLLNKLKEAKKLRKQPLFYNINFDVGWRVSKDINALYPEDDEMKSLATPLVYYKKKKKTNQLSHFQDLNDESQETRYFSEGYNVVKILQEAVNENPLDVKLWLSLVKYVLKQGTVENMSDLDDDGACTTSTELALKMLSKALELNKDSEDLWINLLQLFATISSPKELQELCLQAVMYCPTYRIWWTCLELEVSHKSKHEICAELINFIKDSGVDTVMKSHRILEVILYVVQLLLAQGKLEKACTCLDSFIPNTDNDRDNNKGSRDDAWEYLIETDRSLMMMCRISLMSFNTLPASLFSNKGFIGKIVSKDKFILPWDRVCSGIGRSELRQAFNDALTTLQRKSDSQRLCSPKTLMLIYENLVAFELSCQDFRSGADILHKLVANEPSFVDGWVMLLMVYIQHSPMDVVVKIAEDAIHKCDHDVEIVYHYAKWLKQNGMPGLAKEKLTNAIYKYYEFDDDNASVPDVLILYQKILGLQVEHTVNLPTYLPALKTSHLLYYYWLSYCLLLEIKRVPPTIATYSSSVEEAFETSVYQMMTNDNRKKMLLVYVQWKISQLAKLKDNESHDLPNLIDFMTRAILAVPTSTQLPWDTTTCYSDFSFHNNVIDLVISNISEKHHLTILHKCLQLMPDNSSLALTICALEMSRDNYSQARVIYELILEGNPNCLEMWKVAVDVEMELKAVDEARQLCKEATKKLPYHQVLWKNFVELEFSLGDKDSKEKMDYIKSIQSKALEFGVDLTDLIQRLQKPMNSEQ